MRLDDYLRRIGISGRPAATLAALREIHRAHRETFLFENLSIQAGGTISVALPDLERKFLDERRGGYCFEHNTLFAAALADLGLTSTTLLGRVRRGPPADRGRTHMVLRVPVAGAVWLADVGFGAQSLIEPIPLAEGATAEQLGITYSLGREDHLWVLSARDATGTMEMYEFTEDPQTTTDVEIANYYTSTHPASVFRRTLTVQRVTRKERIALRNDTLVRHQGGGVVEERFDRSLLHRIVRDVFDIELPPGPFVYETGAENFSAAPSVGSRLRAADTC
jgi:N-hydroxyarylamine O-acetyltransferase